MQGDLPQSGACICLKEGMAAPLRGTGQAPWFLLRPGFSIMTKKRYRILVILIAAGFIAGRLAMRAIGNLILGGTLFGGNIL